jgi:hypothetical protein
MRPTGASAYWSWKSRHSYPAVRTCLALHLFLSAVERFAARGAGPSARVGAVAFIHRFGALLNPPVHSIASWKRGNAVTAATPIAPASQLEYCQDVCGR